MSTHSDRTRDQAVPYGIVGDRLHEITRRVPADEPPPLAANAKLKVIGQPVSRFDARAESDRTGSLHVRRAAPGDALRAPRRQHRGACPGRGDRHLSRRTASRRARRPRARSPAADPLGCAMIRRKRRCAIRWSATSGSPGGRCRRDGTRGRRSGPPRAGDLRSAASRGGPGGGNDAGCAARLSRSDRAAGDGGRRRGASGPARSGATCAVRIAASMFGLPRGDVTKGLAEAAIVVDAEYRTQVQTHVPMETHGLVADWREDGLTIYASTQFTTSVRDEAAEMFELPTNRVRVISDFTGGGFGAKYGIGNFGLLAISLSRKAGTAGPADARSPGRARIGRQSAEQPAASASRCSHGRHTDGDRARELRDGRRRGRRRCRLRSRDDVSVRERERRPV